MKKGYRKAAHDFEIVRGSNTRYAKGTLINSNFRACTTRVASNLAKCVKPTDAMI